MWKQTIVYHVGSFELSARWIVCECLHDLEMWQTGDVMVITTTSHERRCVSNHRQLKCLFNRFLGERLWKEIRAPAALLDFVKGIHRWSDYPDKGPVTREMLPCHYVMGARWYRCTFEKIFMQPRSTLNEIILLVDSKWNGKRFLAAAYFLWFSHIQELK